MSQSPLPLPLAPERGGEAGPQLAELGKVKGASGWPQISQRVWEAPLFIDAWLAARDASGLSLPHSMQVAIFPSHNLFCLDLKGGLGGLPRLEELPVSFAVGNEFDPLNVVALLHGMGHTVFST
jgi:hypothetical protein